MIQCTQCDAPIDLRVHECCWNCKCNTFGHPMRSDIRYLIGYSRMSSVMIGMGILLLAALLIWQVICLVSGHVNTGEFLEGSILILVLMIVSCRLLF